MTNTGKNTLAARTDLAMCVVNVVPTQSGREWLKDVPCNLRQEAAQEFKKNYVRAQKEQAKLGFKSVKGSRQLSASLKATGLHLNSDAHHKSFFSAHNELRSID